MQLHPIDVTIIAACLVLTLGGPEALRGIATAGAGRWLWRWHDVMPPPGMSDPDQLPWYCAMLSPL